MKFLKPFLLLCISALPFGGKTQVRPNPVPEISKPSYWMVETGPVQKPYTVIRFYNGMHDKIYEHRAEGKNLNASKPSVQRRLNKAMRRYQWEKNPEVYVLRTK